MAIAVRHAGLSGSVISQSGADELGAWLLVTFVILAVADESQLSLTSILRRTGTMRPFGGQSTLGVAESSKIRGGVVSTIKTVRVLVVVLPLGSLAE